MSKVMRTHTGITEWNGDYYCDVCGRRVKGINIVNGMDFCAKCYQETFGNIEINKLQQQLADRDVKIEVLQKDVDNLHRTLEEANEELAEKNKEIEQLSKEHLEMFGDMKDYKNLWLAEQRKNKEIRKQVCNEIMEELKENVDCYFEERKCNSPHSQLPYIWFNEIRFRKFLDQIEKGE